MKKIEKYFSLEEEARTLTKKLEKLWEKLLESKAEIQDLQSTFQQERTQLNDTVRELNSQIRLKASIIESYIPPEEVEKIERRAVWNDETDSWTLARANVIEEGYSMMHD